MIQSMDGSIDNIPIPARLLERVRALAAAERRSADDVVRQAVEDYLHDHAGGDAPAEERTDTPSRSAPEAIARLLERRKHNVLPKGVTIRDLMTHGRA